MKRGVKGGRKGDLVMRNRFDVKIVVIWRIEDNQQQGVGLEIQNFGVNSFELACCR